MKDDRELKKLNEFLLTKSENDDELKKAFEEVEDEFQNGNTELKDFFEEYII